MRKPSLSKRGPGRAHGYAQIPDAFQRRAPFACINEVGKPVVNIRLLPEQTWRAGAQRLRPKHPVDRVHDAVAAAHARVEHRRVTVENHGTVYDVHRERFAVQRRQRPGVAQL